MIAEGSKAPELNIPDQDGNIVKLKDFKDITLVLYFYPKDDTPGCTLEGQDFTQLKKEFKKADAVILGVSNDDSVSHQKFMEKCSIDLVLLSDTSKKVAQDYDVYKEKQMYGKKYMGIERTTFVIRNGRILKIFPKVNPEGHAKEVLKFVQSI